MKKVLEMIMGHNTIKCNNKEDLEALKEFCKDHFDMNVNLNWEQLERVSYPKRFNGYICVEYQYGKGFTCYFDEKESESWYGEKPIELREAF